MVHTSTVCEKLSSFVILALLGLLLCPVLTAASVHVSPKSQQDLLRYYDYNSSMPLNASETTIVDESAYKVLKVYFDSVNGARVPALLSLPKKAEKVPCVVFLHGYGGSKEDILDAAEPIAKEGYAIVAIDAEYHGERSQTGKELYSPNVTETVNGVVQTVIDLRRAVDYVETKTEIDKEKIGYVGGSMGGILGAIFIGVEPRIEASVLIVAGGNMSLMVKESQHRTMPAIREYVQRENLTDAQIQSLLDPIDPINFIDNFSPRPVVFHLGKFDTTVPAEAGRQLYEKAGQPKTVYWYDSDHNVPLDLVMVRALDFMDRNLLGKSLANRELLYWMLKYAPIIGIVAVASIVVLAAYLIRRRTRLF